MQRSLDAYERSGNLGRQADTLSNLGAVCHWAGRWDDALSYFERAREACTEDRRHGRRGPGAHQHRGDPDRSRRVGRGRGAAVGNAPAVEGVAVSILPWRLPVLDSGACRFAWVASTRRCSRLEEAKSNYLHVGAEEKIPAIDALHRGVPSSQWAIQTPPSNWCAACSAAPSESNGVAKVVPLLERVQGHALLCKATCGAHGTPWRRACGGPGAERSLRGGAHLLSLIELDRLEGVEPPLEMVNESRSLLANLKVRAVPPVPPPPHRPRKRGAAPQGRSAIYSILQTRYG